MPLIAFTSPKGGAGKTTLAAHVAALLARRGHKVLALDLDPQNALRLHFGVPLKDEDGLFPGLLARQPTHWRGAVRDSGPGLRLLSHGTLDPMEVLEFGQLLMERPSLLAAPVREMLSEPGLIVVADTAPGPSPALRAILSQVTLMAVVLLADAASASLLPGIASGRFIGRGVLAMRAAERAALVVNQVALDQPLSAAVLEAAEHAMGDRLLGAVGRDPAIPEALAHKRLLLAEGGASEDIRVLADVILRRISSRGADRSSGAARNAAFPALSEWGLC